jgi:hypothetical protein
MAENSQFPGFIKFNYHSAFGAHTQEICTREWNPVPLVPGNALGSYTNWLGVPCDGQVMVLEYVSKWKPFRLPSSVVDIATVYTMDTETSPPRPRASLAIGDVGSSASTDWSKATQLNYSFRDTEYSIFRLVHLDIPTGDFNPLTDISGSPATIALVGVFTSDAWAWSSRNGQKPQTFLKVVYDLNDKLRKEYGMT